MKFTVVSLLLGATLGAEVVKTEQQGTVEANLLQEDAEMEQLCKDIEYDTIHEDSLLDVDESSTKYSKAIKESYKSRTGLTKKQIDAQNRHILSTQAKCLKFVRNHRGHRAVCNWCKKAKAPKIIWKWSPTEKVWYRWYDNKWNYWGPSKRGFTRGGWTWYAGYWHHGGYVWKYYKDYWYRFQGGRWVKYGKKVPISPKKPRGKPICRPFYRLMKYGFPTSLSRKRMPRCQVGSGKAAGIYYWKNRAACKFLGGRLTYHVHKLCKAGKPHTWKRVVKCVRGPVLSTKYEGLLFRVNKDPKVYQILDGKVRWVPNGKTFTNLYKSWSSVHSVTTTAYKAMVGNGAGRRITNGAYLLAAKGQNPVYLVIDGKRRWICNPKTFNAFHFNWGKIHKHSRTTVARIPKGPTICLK